MTTITHPSFGEVPPDRIIVFDTTLRDGEQSPGFSMNLEEKLRMAEALEDLGVDVIEAGFAIASPGDFASVRAIAEKLQGTVVCSLARSGRADIQAAADALKPARRKRIHTFISTSPLHMKYKLQMEPEAVLAAVLGTGSVFVTEGLFFSQAAVVTFGGAYAVLAWIAQQAVEVQGWLQPGEMLDGLGLAETTPGPLIMVVQFVGFLGAWRHPEMLPPGLAGMIGACVTVWVTFVPCFLWIFVGAPWVEALRGHRPLRVALSAITAAVVGVILNLALWFGLHVVFARVGEQHVGPVRLLVPEWGTVDPAAAVLTAGALVAMLRYRVGLPATLAACAALGAAWRMVGS